jgi:hypothetical protein
MLIVQKKPFMKGLAMTIIFFGVLAYMFTPNFGGKNAFDASDELFNTMAKGSTNYFPKLRKAAEPFKTQAIDVSLDLPAKQEAAEAVKILSAAGVSATQSGEKVVLKGKLGQVVNAMLNDAETMFKNDGDKIKAQYGIDEKKALYVWWLVVKEISQELNKQGGDAKYKAAAFLDDAKNRGVEVGYNFYKIEPQSAKSKAGILTFALVFYVAYTLWWGFAVYFLTEGFGLALSGGAKKEH